VCPGGSWEQNRDEARAVDARLRMCVMGCRKVAFIATLGYMLVVQSIFEGIECLGNTFTMLGAYEVTLWTFSVALTTFAFATPL